MKNEEIKEILEQLRDVAKKDYFIVEDGNVTQGHFEPSRPATMYINNFTANLLLDYITNLQKRYDNLNEENELVRCDLHNAYSYNEGLTRELEDYKSRIDKAIEYTKEHTDKLLTSIVPKIDFNYKELLNILKGDSDE